MFIEIHSLQTFSAANLNRDDANAIKTITFGNTLRQRVSSQCIKRSIRKNEIFATEFAKQTAVRTKKFAQEVFNVLETPKPSADQLLEMSLFCKALGLGELELKKSESKKKSAKKGEDSDSEGTGGAGGLAGADVSDFPSLKTLFFFSDEEIKGAAEAFKSEGMKGEKAASAFGKLRKSFSMAPEVALFGRMAADGPKFNVDAAVQVAHGISTNEIDICDDYFTAVDDLSDRNESAGAAMIGTTQVASPCLYRYACISWETLKSNLGNSEIDAKTCVNAFLRAFVDAIPTGKAAGTAPQSRPAFVMVTVGKSQPMNLANSFERAVVGDEYGLTDQSALKLGSYLVRMNKMYDFSSSRKSFFCEALDEKASQEFGQKVLDSGCIKTKNISELLGKTVELLNV